LEINTQHTVDGFTVTFNSLPPGLYAQTDSFETETDSDPLIVKYESSGTYDILFSGHARYIDCEIEVTVG
jgi:hypothetical protein